MAMNNYFFNEQITKYTLQFMAIFKGLHYETGKREDGETRMLPVPVIYGSRDRVTASIMANNTQNAPLRIPLMSAYQTGMRVANERRKGNNLIRRETFLEKGGLFPNDIKVAEQLMPNPYDLQFELAIYTSNMDQHRQILEQILMYFDPFVQIQTSDEHMDWTKITQVELTDISYDENYPAGVEKRTILSTLTFVVPIYIAAPSNLKTNWVNDIYMRITTLENSDNMEYIIASLDAMSDPYELVATGSGIPPTQIGVKCPEDDDSSEIPAEDC